MGQVPVKSKLPREEMKRLKRAVSFSEDEIQEWWREFAVSARGPAHDRYLYEEEFLAVYNSVYSGDGTDFAKHVFRTFDKNGDGKVNFREFLVGLSMSGSMQLEKKLKWAFQIYDVKKTGCITREDMREIIQAVSKMLGPQAGAIINPEELTDQLFKHLDENGDQVISWREFCDGAMKHSAVLDLLQCAPCETETM